ncbi:MAG: ABC transporter permease [Candidatus Nanopelagicales bacterium]
MSQKNPQPALAPAEPGFSHQELRALVDEWGLASSTARQPIGKYISELWSRRDFVVALATGRNTAAYTNTALGRVWQVLAPILNALVYYLVFGLLLNTKKGVDNFVAFLIIGVFTFTYTQRCVTGGTKAIANNRQLIRAVHFPRAVLPTAVVIQEIQQQIVSMGVMFVIVLLSGEPLTFSWLGVIPILLMQSMFNAGICLLVARWTAASGDVTQLVPFVMHTWRYFSGVFYSIEVFTEGHAEWVRTVMYANPATTYIELMRDCLMESHDAPGILWAYGLGWGVVMLVVGFFVFYRAEESYARG